MSTNLFPALQNENRKTNVAITKFFHYMASYHDIGGLTLFSLLPFVHAFSCLPSFITLI
jgi:hypothetical protein